jgi:hypothetical protein
MADVRLECETIQPGLGRVGHHHLHLFFSRRSRLVSIVLLVAATALIAWTIFLEFTLPPKYDAGHWNLLRTGFDVGLSGILGYAAWAAWFRRQILATTAIVAGTLLLAPWPFPRVVADKVAASFEMHEGRPSTRYRDLSDLYLLQRQVPFERRRLRAAVLAELSKRGLEHPGRLRVPERE